MVKAREIEVRRKEAESEKITINLGYVDLGHIDLLIVLETSRQADAATALLLSASFEVPHIDGELVFNDGAAVPWREWAWWRAGRVERVLVKRPHGAALEDPRSWNAVRRSASARRRGCPADCESPYE